MKKVGIFVNPGSEAAGVLARDVNAYLLANGTEEVWTSSDWDDAETMHDIPGTDLLICLGGDGTVLRAARTVIPHDIPLLGVNLGRLGFLAEVRPDQLMEYLPRLRAGDYRLESRAMLQARIPTWGATLYALNDVVVGRRTVGRPVYVEVMVNGSRLAIHRCDAIIAATATGSTAYSLSAGGPVLHPESADIIVTPVSTHMAAARPVVLPPDTLIDLVASAGKDPIVSIDGQINRDLNAGDFVHICQSAHRARFIRFSDPADYYAMLSERLEWLRVLHGNESPELSDVDTDGVAAPHSS